MKIPKVRQVYQSSLVAVSIILPSPLYGIAWIAMGIIFLCWLQSKDYGNIKRSVLRPEVFFPAFLYVIILIGFIFSVNKGQALSSLSTRAPFLLFPLLIGTASVIDKKLISRCSIAFIFSTCLFLLIAILYGLFDILRTGVSIVLIDSALYNKLVGFGLTRAYGNFHPTYASLFASLSIALLFIERKYYIFSQHRVLHLMALTFLGLCVVLLNSIVGFLACAALILYGFFQLFHNMRYAWLFRFVTIIVIGGILIFVYQFNPLENDKIESIKTKALKSTDAEGERNLLTFRLAKWDTYFSLIDENWLWGITEGDIKEERKRMYSEKGYKVLSELNYNAHNQYLDIWALYGLPGFTVFYLMIIFPLLARSKLPYAAPFLLIVLIVFLTESVLYRQQGILFFMFFYALFTSRVNSEKIGIK